MTKGVSKPGMNQYKREMGQLVAVETLEEVGGPIMTHANATGP
jgi:hypothetical protein